MFGILDANGGPDNPITTVVVGGGVAVLAGTIGIGIRISDKQSTGNGKIARHVNSVTFDAPVPRQLVQSVPGKFPSEGGIVPVPVPLRSFEGQVEPLGVFAEVVLFVIVLILPVNHGGTPVGSEFAGDDQHGTNVHVSSVGIALQHPIERLRPVLFQEHLLPAVGTLNFLVGTTLVDVNVQFVGAHEKVALGTRDLPVGTDAFHVIFQFGQLDRTLTLGTVRFQIGTFPGAVPFQVF